MVHAFAAQGDSERVTSLSLGDGCRHVFLDVGANRGVHVRFLTEPHLFPKSSFLARGFFRDYFGPGFATDPAICAFGFEPNLHHSERLLRLAQSDRARGRRVEFFGLAAEAQAGVITMYDHRGDYMESDWRFGAKRKSWRPINISAIDLAAFVRHEIANRTIPAGDGPPPAVVMKLVRQCSGRAHVHTGSVSYRMMCRQCTVQSAVLVAAWQPLHGVAHKHSS